MITPNNFFDEIFCINLNRRNDRWNAVNKRFQREGIHVTRFEGKDQLDDDVKMDYALLKREKPNTGIKTRGGYAILLTYLKLYKMILRQKDLNKILIFEDDILFHKDFANMFDKSVNALPNDWEMWALATSQLGRKDLKYTEDKLFYQPTLPNKTYGLFSFSIKRSYIPTIINYLEKRISPADVQIYTHTDNGKSKIYVSNPFICAHEYGYSDNMNAMMDDKLADTKNWQHRKYDMEKYH